MSGTGTRGIYDNMKTAVETIFVSKGVSTIAASADVQPLSGRSGRLHASVGLGEGTGRGRGRAGCFFTRRLRFKNLDELNAWLLDKCIAYAKVHRHRSEERRVGKECRSRWSPDH